MRAALGLGSNVGDRRNRIEAAIAGLDGVRRVSRLYETDPVGGPPQGPYLNAALVLETALDARGLLARAQGLEAAAGRARDLRWGPRTLDIDLLLCDQLVIAEPDLIVPHARLAERFFVLAPLAEVAPDWVVPGLNRTVEELLAALSVRP